MIKCHTVTTGACLPTTNEAGATAAGKESVSSCGLKLSDRKPAVPTETTDLDRPVLPGAIEVVANSVGDDGGSEVKRSRPGQVINSMESHLAVVEKSESAKNGCNKPGNQADNSLDNHINGSAKNGCNNCANSLNHNKSKPPRAHTTCSRHQKESGNHSCSLHKKHRPSKGCDKRAKSSDTNCAGHRRADVVAGKSDHHRSAAGGHHTCNKKKRPAPDSHYAEKNITAAAGAVNHNACENTKLSSSDITRYENLCIVFV